MTIEHSKQGFSPYQRLEEHFRKISIQKDPSFKDVNFRQISLEDNTTINIESLRNHPTGPIESYRVRCDPMTMKQGAISHDQAFEFVVSKDGLIWIELPKFELRIGDAIVSEERFKRKVVKEDRQLRIILAGTLVDWLDGIKQNNKYTPPPISFSFSPINHNL